MYGDRTCFYSAVYKAIAFQNCIKLFRISRIHITQGKAAAAHRITHGPHSLFDRYGIYVHKKPFYQFQIFQLQIIAFFLIAVKIRVQILCVSSGRILERTEITPLAPRANAEVI